MRQGWSCVAVHMMKMPSLPQEQRARVQDRSDHEIPLMSETMMHAYSHFLVYVNSHFLIQKRTVAAPSLLGISQIPAGLTDEREHFTLWHW